MPTPIVRPEWVVDSLKAGKLLPVNLYQSAMFLLPILLRCLLAPSWLSCQGSHLQVRGYQLWRLRDGPGQQALAAFTVQPQSRSVTDIAAPQTVKGSSPGKVQPAQAQPGQQPVQAELHAADQAAPGPASAHAEPCSAVARDNLTHQQAARPRDAAASDRDAAADIASVSAPSGHAAPEGHQVCGRHARTCTSSTCKMQCPCPTVSARACRSIAPDEVLLKLCNTAPPSCTHESNAQAAASSRAANMAAQEVATRARAACDVLRGPPQTTHDNPEFMETYFRSSRLHFIGTWKARIEALAARMCPDAPSPAPVRTC